MTMNTRVLWSAIGLLLVQPVLVQGAYSLQMALNDAQRQILSERLEYTRALWMAHMKLAHPGGWRGLMYWLARSLKRAHRVFTGPTEYSFSPGPSLDWSKLAPK